MRRTHEKRGHPLNISSWKSEKKRDETDLQGTREGLSRGERGCGGLSPNCITGKDRYPR